MRTLTLNSKKYTIGRERNNFPVPRGGRATAYREFIFEDGTREVRYYKTRYHLGSIDWESCPVVKYSF